MSSTTPSKTICPATSAPGAEESLLHGESPPVRSASTVRSRGRLFVEQSGLVETPGRSVVQVEVPIGTVLLAREVLTIRARHEARKLFVAELFEFLGRDGAPHAQRRFHTTGRCP